KDYRDLIWLSQILWFAPDRRLEKIESLLRRAVALAGDKPDAWVALVQYQARTGQKTKAAATIEEAKGHLPTGQAALALAQCYEIIGRVEQAREQYQAALAANPRDLATLQGVAKFYLRRDQPEEAGTCLRKIIALKAFSPEEARWAQR